MLAPLARPAMMTLAILTFLYTWNDYLWPLVSARRGYFTITLGLASIQSNFAQSEGLDNIMASGLLPPSSCRTFLDLCGARHSVGGSKVNLGLCPYKTWEEIMKHVLLGATSSGNGCSCSCTTNFARSFFWCLRRRWNRHNNICWRSALSNL